MKSQQIRAKNLARHFIVVSGTLLFVCSAKASDIQSIKTQVIAQASTKFGMDAKDLQGEQLTVTPMRQNNGGTAYHVVGQFTLGWLQPRNPDEVAQIYASHNRCTFAGVDCQPGIHHTIYVDVTVAQSQSSATLNISGNESLNQKIEQQQEQTIDELSVDNPHLSDAVEAANPKNCRPVVVSRSTPTPTMPPQSVRQRHAGTTVLQILLNSDGTIRDTRVYESSGFRELDRAAIESASRWQYSPVVCAGTNEPAVAAIRVPITFGLHNKVPQVAPLQ